MLPEIVEYKLPSEPDNHSNDNMEEDIRAALDLGRLKIRLATAALKNLQDNLEQMLVLLQENPSVKTQEIMARIKSFSAAANIPLRQIAAYMHTLSTQLDKPPSICPFHEVSSAEYNPENRLLNEVNAFYDWLAENPLPTDAQALWHVLMYVYYKYGCPEEFTVSNTGLVSTLAISRAQLDRMRNILIDKGLVAYQLQPGPQAGFYTVIPFVSHDFVEKNNRPETHFETHSETLAEDAYDFVDYIERFP